MTVLSIVCVMAKIQGGYILDMCQKNYTHLAQFQWWWMHAAFRQPSLLLLYSLNSSYMVIAVYTLSKSNITQPDGQCLWWDAVWYFRCLWTFQANWLPADVYISRNMYVTVWNLGSKQATLFFCPVCFIVWESCSRVHELLEENGLEAYQM